MLFVFFFFFQAEDGIRDWTVTGVQTCALPIYLIDQVRWARANPERATAIGLAGQELARRELTREAAARAWALTLGRLAERSEERRVGKEGRSRVVADS